MRNRFQLLVNSIPAATGGLRTIRTSESLSAALTEMHLANYSQLGVIDDDGRFVGVVTWRSVAVALSRRPTASLGDAIQIAETVAADAELLPLVQRIYDNDFVIVTNGRNEPLGLVTTADLTLEFAPQAELYSLLGELEWLLRVSISRVFTVEQLTEVAVAAGERLVLKTFEHAGLPQYESMLKMAGVFQGLAWPLSQSQVVEGIHRARKFRNSVMHFDDEPIADDDVRHVRNLVAMLRMYAPRTYHEGEED